MKLLSKAWLVFIASTVMLAAGLSYVFLYYVPQQEKKQREQKAVELEIKQSAEAGKLFQHLEKRWSAFIKAEAIDDQALPKAREELKAHQGQDLYAREPVKTLLVGLMAYSNEDFKAAEEAFAKLRKENQPLDIDPYIVSFQAAASLRLGNTAIAGELYLKAIELKRKSDYTPIDISTDRLGLALSLFLLGKVEEAHPWALQALADRINAQADALDVLSAANRLATIKIALQQQQDAEHLLLPLYNYYDELNTRIDDKRLNAVLEESNMILKLLSSEAPAQTAKKQEGPPPTIEELASWKTLADKLQAAHSPFAPLLLEHILAGQASLTGHDIFNSDLLPLHLAIAKAYFELGETQQALNVLTPMLTITDMQKNIDFFSMTAQCFEAQGNYAEAESSWQKAADLSDACLPKASSKAKAKEDDVNRSFNLHMSLAENYSKQKRMSEAEIELMLALGLVNKKSLNDYSGTAEIYFRLSSILKDMGRKRDSQAYLRKAHSTAKSLLKKNLSEHDKKMLTNILSTKEALNSNKIESKSEQNLVVAALPDPQLLRDELRIMPIVNGQAIFKQRIEDILKEAATFYGENSTEFLRYYSLKLKFLEESGAVDQLNRELESQASQPKGATELEKELNRSSALSYAARVNEKVGRLQQAATYYSQALEGLTADDPAINSRREIISNELKRLQGAPATPQH